MDQTDRMISLQFDWGRERKEVSSIFIGTSPEFELALYTLCFVAGAEVTLTLPRMSRAGFHVSAGRACSGFLPIHPLSLRGHGPERARMLAISPDLSHQNLQ